MPKNKTCNNYPPGLKNTINDRQNEEIIRANEHAKSFMYKDMTSFWKGIKHNNNSKVPLAPMIDKCIGEKDICDMWQAHYRNLLNRVETSKSKKFLNKSIDCSTLGGIDLDTHFLSANKHLKSHYHTETEFNKLVHLEKKTLLL